MQMQIKSIKTNEIQTRLEDEEAREQAEVDLRRRDHPRRAAHRLDDGWQDREEDREHERGEDRAEERAEDGDRVKGGDERGGADERLRGGRRWGGEGEEVRRGAGSAAVSNKQQQQTAIRQHQFDNNPHLDGRDRDQVEDAERGKGEEDQRRAEGTLPAAHADICPDQLLRFR